MAENRYESIASIVLAVYIVAAIAFECTANTARISTIGIYLVFVTGLVLFIKTGQIQINEHCVCLIILLAYIYCMTAINHNSLSNTIAYYYLTCTVLCLIGYNLFIHSDREQATVIYCTAIILGAMILAARIIISYGGVTAMAKFASDGIDERRIGGNIINENTLGLYMGNAIFCCIVLLRKLKAKRPLISLCLLFLSAFFAAMLLLSASKKAVLFLILGITIMFFFYLHGTDGNRKLSVMLISLFVIAAILYVIMHVSIFRSVSIRFRSLFDFFSDNSSGSISDQNRSYMISSGLSAFLDSPIFGNGAAYSYTLYGTYSHNNFVELLMNYGIIGFSVYYFPYIKLIPRLTSLMRKGDFLALYFLIFVAAQVILGIGWVNYYERVTQLITIIAGGYVEKYEEEIGINEKKSKYII